MCVYVYILYICTYIYYIYVHIYNIYTYTHIHICTYTYVLQVNGCDPTITVSHDPTITVSAFLSQANAAAPAAIPPQGGVADHLQNWNDNLPLSAALPNGCVVCGCVGGWLSGWGYGWHQRQSCVGVRVCVHRGCYGCVCVRERERARPACARKGQSEGDRDTDR